MASAVGYCLLIPLSLAGIVGLWVPLVRSHRRGGNWRPWARAWLFSVSTLVVLIVAEGGTMVWRAVEMSSEPALPRTLPASPGKALRLVVIGGSSARLSVSAQAFHRPDRRLAAPGRSASKAVELEILAEGGASLEVQYRKLAEIKYRPDALIIYSGHNEFWTHYPWIRRVHPPRNLLEWARRRSRFCRLIDEAIDLNRIDAPSTPALSPPAIDWPACDARERAERRGTSAAGSRRSSRFASDSARSRSSSSRQATPTAGSRTDPCSPPRPPPPIEPPPPTRSKPPARPTTIRQSLPMKRFSHNGLNWPRRITAWRASWRNVASSTAPGGISSRLARPTATSIGAPRTSRTFTANLPTSR